MDNQENSSIVNAAYASFQRGDVPGLLEKMSGDVIWQLPDMPGVPFGGRRQGPAQVADFVKSLVESSEILSFEPRTLFSRGDQVVALGEARYRTRSTGRQWGGDFAHVFTVREGKISQFRELGDTASTVAAFA